MVVQHCHSAIDTSFAALGPAKIAFLGVVQGITELLPISSSAHMRAVPAFLGWPDPGAAFSAAMQLAALAAVVTYFGREIWSVTGGSIRAIGKGDWRNRDFIFSSGVVIATIPIAIAGAALANVLNACGSPLRTPMVVGIACFVMALLMGLAEIVARHTRSSEGLTIWDALLVGLAQVGALIPGVSRSGSTFAAAMFLGFKREDAARISFLLGVPAIALAGGKELFVLYQARIDPEAWKMLGIGLVVSSASAFVAVWGLMRFLRHSSSWPLVIYRALFGLVLIVGAAMHWIS
jgi:undecaprenyl-diphosphatase